MKTFAWMRARPRAVASASVVTATVMAITTLAFVYDGNPTTEVDLHDGGIWVTKQSAFLVGHFNHESQVLDGSVKVATADYDILQSGATVLVVDAAESTVTTVDPASVTLADSADIPVGATVALGGQTAAILDPKAGKLWVLPATALAGFSAARTKPVTTLGKGADVTVGVDGTVHAVSLKRGEIVSIPVDAQGEAGELTRHEVDGLEPKDEVDITAVGATAVVLDGDTIVTSTDVRTTVPGVKKTADAQLQQPSADNTAVALATASALVHIPLDGAKPEEQAAGAEGVPAAPVYLRGCTYAAWSGSAKFVRDCAGKTDDLAVDVEGSKKTSVLRFRQNRDVVVLNDVFGGAAWMASESMQRVNNWSDLTPPKGDDDSDDESETTVETVETTLPERSSENTPPIAKDDEFGVRPGRTTILPIIDNDTDADGDVLVATVKGGAPSLGTIQPINDGAGLQIAVPADAKGSESFVYEVDDGRGGTATATVQLSVHDFDKKNLPPKQNRETIILVEADGTVSYNLLPDWVDPDGDDVFLRAVAPAPGDEVDFTPDGRITYRAISGTQGVKDVEIIVSDGTDQTVGVVHVDVRPAGSTVPVTNADHIVVRAGQSVTVAPLTNDTSSGSESLRLTRVDNVEGTTILPDYPNRTFSFLSNQPGTYYVQYQASSGANTTPGVVRVDVLADEETDLSPIAVRDVALLPSGGEVLVNVLANDADPSGGILVVQSVTVAPNSGVSVAVLNHETLRISDQAALSEQVRIAYRISNGKATADGEVVVQPVPAPSQLLPPVANDDEAVVRAGDIVTIPVLANDYHPNGDAIHVAPDLVPPLIDPKDGDLFISQDAIRFRASEKPGTVYATYEVVDSTGQKDAGYVTIQVLPVDVDTNTAPRPRDLVVRALSGSKVTITVPLDGLDADGDSVDLVGIASAPKKGSVEVGTNTIEYTAFDDASGVDTLTYRVRDRLGKEGTASIRIGIAPPEAANQSPYAVKDSVVMRPDREVAVPVTVNDSDPDGDAIILETDGLILPDVKGLKAKVVGNRIVVTSPSEPIETSLQYTIRDAQGATSTAVLQVTVAEDVPLRVPIARDDRILAEEVQDGVVDVDVLVNDEDPDGTTEALTVTVVDPAAKVLPDGKIRVTLTAENQLVTYTITDQDGLSTSAFIRVPSVERLAPWLTTVTPVEVKSGETIQISLADHVQAGGDAKVVITEAAKVSAGHANGDPLVGDQTTLVYTSADKYFGQDSITFEVTDGTGPDDPKGRKATLVLPITVLPPDNQPPSFVNGSIDVAPGEDASTLDLRAMTSDPDADDLGGMKYSIVDGVPSGLSAEIQGQQLSVSAASDARKGTVSTIRLRITDGHTDAITGTVTVRVTASTRPLPTANDDVIAEADQGKPLTISVLDNDFNPFPETPLKVTAAVTETGRGELDFTGSSVTVTPDADFFGTMVVRYRIQDVTKDPEREVEGRIRLTVQGKPEAPGTPTVTSEQDRKVVLAWTPPANNGAEITGYTVKSVKGGYTKECAATTCTLDGLTNNVEYNFVVIAHNRVGPSDASPPSKTARPDARPDTPNPPTLQFGDRSLKVAWVTPSTPGSPVSSFTLEISPAPPSGVSQKPSLTGNSYTWEGLENGVAYQVRVRAHNRAPLPSSWSTYSAAMVPAGPPAAPAKPTTARLDPVGSQAQMQVSWNAPANNGDAISGYRLNVLRGGAVVNTIAVPAGQTSQAVVVDTSTSNYTFTVAASNKAGWGATSPQSAERRAFVAPGAPTNLQASTPSNDGRIVVTYGPAAGNGATTSEVFYEYNVGGAWRRDWDGMTITNGIANNNSYTVQVRAFTDMDGVRYDGAPSNSAGPVAPYGPVGQPGATATASGTNIHYTWSAPARNGRDIVSMEVQFDGGAWQSVALNGSTDGAYGYSQTHTMNVRTRDAAGQESTNSASATTVAPPPPTLITLKGAYVNTSDCSHPSCGRLVLEAHNFPGGTYTVRCDNSVNPPGTWRTAVIPSDGQVQLSCYFGIPGQTAWVEVQGYGNSTPITWY